MFENIKNKYDQWSVKKRLDQKMAKRAQAQIDLENAILHPEDTKKYNRALHQLARQQTASNFLSFGRWLITDLLWLIVPYLPYSVFQSMLNNTILTNSISSRALFAVQEQLIMVAIITGVFTLVTLEHLIKKGWYHRPYKKGSVNQTVQEIKEKHAQKHRVQNLKNNYGRKSRKK